MTLPDQTHINQVREALHRRTGNGASVMVGSGFSRNADRISITAKEMPSWQGLVDHFYNSLYPQDKASRNQENARPATDNTRIAQEYEAAFGRSALHDTLRRLIPDEGYKPGKYHERLLKLPWRDVYTTNWDTLLERGRAQVPEQDYRVVRNMGEIPMSRQPRIVKLHGSFPADFPLIVTEEDYRTYPKTFAPFVNTVQQAMMETVFLLIGFSGDDPNFLNWSGWVRDNLGASAPRIYLAGWLKLSTHRRHMLEIHNVVPIDLAQHPTADQWPETLRDQYATDWLLHTLELGRPYNITSWPTPSNQQENQIRDILQPVSKQGAEEPEPEPYATGSNPSSSPDEVRKIITGWKHNRSMYPGWLTMPFTGRREMELKTRGWGEVILATLPSLDPIERLRAIRELVWREEILLIPRYSDVETAIQDTLSPIDCRERKIKGATVSNVDWISIRDDYLNIAVTMVTAARFRFNLVAFEEAIQALEEFHDEDQEIRHRIRHEKCLWAIYNGDFNSLRELLSDWETEHSDPVWTLRKSAMHLEAGQQTEAKELLNRAINAIRAMPLDERSLARQSRESWARFVDMDWENRLTSLDRLRELVHMKCDVFGERQNVIESMKSKEKDEDPPLFDINLRRGTRLPFSNYRPWEAVYRAVRLSEIVGAPPDGDTLERAAEELPLLDTDFAARLILRTSGSSSKKTLERVFSRARVASMSTEQADTLAQVCLNILKYEEQDINVRKPPGRFCTAAELLSRLAIRLDPQKAEDTLDQALGYYQHSELAKSPTGDEVQSLMERAWEAMTEENRSRRAMGLLTCPIVGMNNVEPFIESRWPEPSELLNITKTTLLRTTENEPEWQKAISLTVQGLSGNETSRRRAAIRMFLLASSQLLSEEESKIMAQALWTERYTSSVGLPSGTNVFDWAFLTLPEPSPGLALERFRTKWLRKSEDVTYEFAQRTRGIQNGLNDDTLDIDSRLWQANGAIRALKEERGELVLATSEKAHLTSLIESWVEEPVPEVKSPQLQSLAADATKRSVQTVAASLPAILGAIEASASLIEGIYQKLQSLTKNQIPVFEVTTALVRYMPERSEEIATEIQVGVTSESEDVAGNAMSGLYTWLTSSSDDESQNLNPPDDLIRGVGIAIASRRNAVIVPALQVAKWIFENGTDAQKESIRQLTEDGLSYLAQDLRYDREQETPEEVPRKRLYCAELAAEMAKTGLGQTPAVAQWIDIARQDPLPEVRHAIARNTPSKPESTGGHRQTGEDSGRVGEGATGADGWAPLG